MTGIQGNRGISFVIDLQHSAQQDQIILYITTPSDESEVTVTISYPKPTQPDVWSSISVTKGAYQRVVLPGKIVEFDSGEVVKAVNVTASDLITITVVNDFQSCNSYLAIPTTDLGRMYVVSTWGIGDSFVDVVATEDQTSVVIEVPEEFPSNIVEYEGVLYGNGESIAIELDALQGASLVSTRDLSGLKITADKAIAVYSGTLNALVGGGPNDDHIMTQLPDIDTWGYNFTLPSIPDSNDGYYVKIMPLEDATIHVGTEDHWKASGRNLILKIFDNEPTFVHSISPLLVVQYFTSSSDITAPAALLMQPARQLPTEYYFTVPDEVNTVYYILVTIDHSEVLHISINGDAFSPTRWMNVTGNSELSMGYTTIQPGAYRLTHDDVDVPFWASIYGVRPDRCALALPAGQNYDILPRVIKEVSCFLKLKQICFGFLCHQY